MTNAWHYQIKAAQRDLITAAGGIERVVRLTNFSKSVVGRWNNPSDPEHMPLSAVRVLEMETSQPLITSIMAHESGRKLLEPNGPITEAAALDQLTRGLLMDVAELASTATAATDDGHVSHTEATIVGHPLARARDRVRQIEQLLGAVKAAGGAPSNFTVVGGRDE